MRFIKPPCGLVLVGFLFASAIITVPDSLAQQRRQFTLPKGKTVTDIVPDEIIIKLNAQSHTTNGRTLSTTTDIDINSLPNLIGLEKATPLDPAAASSSGRQMPSKYLSGVYRLKLSEPNALLVINQLLRYENVVYAEPVFKEQLFLVPNDPDAATNTTLQSYLSSIKAYDAWGITGGDSTVVIGIIDTGVDYNHEDLAANIFLNNADPIDGEDNDGNGYIDDYRGWDFANRDSDVMADYSPHGSHVSGISSARANNGKGMAGTGFSSKFVPLKAFKTEDNTSNGTYEAIIYAANQGFDVLNLSWGSINSYNAAAQDVINYAVLEKNAVIVAAAGNTNAELTFYPASYDNVLSVGASTTTGTKASFATYSYYIDLIAPGSGVYSTRNNNTYGTSDGSSFSTPMVAGAAALLKSYFPKYSAVQIMELLRINGRPVDELSENSAYQGLLGRGLLDMYAALTDTLSPSVRLYGFTPKTQTGTKVYYGDTVRFDLTAVNWLKPASGLEISFESLSNTGVIQSPTWVLPSLGTFDSTQNTVSFLLEETTPPNTRVVVKAKMTAPDYSDFQHFEFTTQPDSDDIISSNMELTLGSGGDLGFLEDSLKSGNGLSWRAESMAKQAGFMIGSSKDNLVDNVIDNLVYSTKTNEFETTKYLKSFSGAAADAYFENAFEAAISSEQTVLIEQKTMGWLSPADSNFIITEYRITNTSPDTISNLHAGLFTNWDLSDETQNHTIWVDSLKLGLTYSHTEKRFGGIALLSSHTPTFFAADISNENGHVPDEDSLLSDSTKFAWLSSNFIKSEAGKRSTGNNTAQMNGVNIGKLAGYDSHEIAFAWVAATTADGIVRAVRRARSKYILAESTPRTMATIFACNNAPATLTLTSGDSFNFYQDAKGADSLLFSGNGYVTDTISKSAIFYVRNTDENYMGEVFSVQVKIDPVKSAFSLSMDTVLLESSEEPPTILFTDESTGAISWSWDFGNGFQSYLKSPQSKYSQPGKYLVRQTAYSEAGCEVSSTKEVLVANRGQLPAVNALSICAGETARISASNASLLRVYTDSIVQNLVFEGAAYSTAPLQKDTVFYITNADSLFESRPVRVPVILNQPLTDFQYLPDTTTLLSSLLLVAESSELVSYKWFASDVLIGEEKTASFLLDGQAELTVELEVTNEQGCRATETKNLVFTKSATPSISDANICPGASYTLAPGNGNNFMFYIAGSEGPVYKGKSYEVTDVRDTVTMVITGVDDLIESDPVEVKVIPFDIDADFSIEPAVLILKKQKTAVFTSLSAGASSWQWKINGVPIDISEDLVLAFDSAGIYEVSLAIENEVGCMDTLVRQYEVVEVTGIRDIGHPLQLFPNPTSGKIYLRKNIGTSTPVLVRVFNLVGQEVMSSHFTPAETQETTELSLEHLPAGVYHFVLSSQNQFWQQRIILQ